MDKQITATIQTSSVSETPCAMARMSKPGRTKHQRDREYWGRTVVAANTEQFQSRKLMARPVEALMHILAALCVVEQECIGTILADVKG